MQTQRRTKRRARAPEPVALPIVQVVPNNRLRLDRTVIPDLVCWLMCSAKEWERAAHRTLRGLKGQERETAKAHIRYARYCCTAVQQLINRVTETWSVEEHSAAMAKWLASIETGVVYPVFPSALRPVRDPKSAG